MESPWDNGTGPEPASVATMNPNPIYIQALIDGLQRDYETLLTADASLMEAYLSYFWSAFEQGGEPLRQPAVDLLRQASAHFEEAALRDACLAMAERIASAPSGTPVFATLTDDAPDAAIQAAMPALHFSMMRPGERYRIMNGFVDFDGQTLPEALELTFEDYHFFPYDGGYTVRFAERVVRLAEIRPGNDEILRNLGHYFQRIP